MAQRVEPVSPLRASAQVASGALLTTVGFVAAGWGTERLAEGLGWSEERASQVAYVGAYTGAWLGGALGPVLTGKDGRAVHALGGSLAGLGGAVIVARLANWRYDEDRHGCGPLCWTLGAVTIALPSIGATLAYNAGRK
jgi:hypothetical protein